MQQNFSNDYRLFNYEKTQNSIAFLIPVYNGDNAILFRRALNSILDQSVPENTIRIYLGIDGPISASLELVVTDFSPRIYKVERTPTCEGIQNILNFLIASLEDEEFIFRMDSDDASLPERVSRQLSYFATHPEVGILGGAIQEIDADGKPLCIRIYPKRDRVKKYIRFASPLAHPTVAFRRQAIEQLGGYPNFRYNQDLWMWFAALEKGIEIDNIEDIVLLYQVSPAFYGRRSYARAFSEAKAYIVGNYRLHGFSLILLAPVIRLIFRILPSCIVQLIYHMLPFRSYFLNFGSRSRA